MIYFLRESSDLGLALAVTIKWVLGFLLGYLYLLRMFLVYSARKHCCFYFKCLCVVCSPRVCVFIVCGSECKLP